MAACMKMGYSAIVLLKYTIVLSWVLPPLSLMTLMMEAVCTSETSVPEGYQLQEIPCLL
jgi:hypothetical protein